MWVAIVGSRSFGLCTCPPVENAETIHPESCAMLRGWLLVLGILTRLTAREGFEGIVSGGAEGADTMAADAAKMFEIKCVVYRPDRTKEPFWVRAKKRNAKIVKKLGTDGWVVALFAPGPRSPGTTDTIEKARAAGLQTHIYHEGKWTTA